VCSRSGKSGGSGQWEFEAWNVRSHAPLSGSIAVNPQTVKASIFESRRRRHQSLSGQLFHDILLPSIRREAKSGDQPPLHMRP